MEIKVKMLRLRIKVKILRLIRKVKKLTLRIKVKKLMINLNHIAGGVKSGALHASCTYMQAALTSKLHKIREPRGLTIKLHLHASCTLLSSCIK